MMDRPLAQFLQDRDFTVLRGWFSDSLLANVNEMLADRLAV